MKTEKKLIRKRPDGKRPVNLKPAISKPNPTGFIIIRLQKNVSIDGSDLRRDGKEKLPKLTTLLERFPEIVTRRVVRSVDPKKLLAMEKAAATSEFPPLHSLTSYWRLDCRKLNTPIEELLKNLKELSEVDHAYIEKPVSDPTVDDDDDTYAGDQDYLDPAPMGIDARWAWTQANGDGAGVGFVDLEHSWNLDHEDLVAKAPTLSYGDNSYDEFENDHGTAVLGIVVGEDNEVGIVGIAPGVSSVRVVSRYDATPDPGSEEIEVNVASAIAHAAEIMAPGDVLLLEVQKYFAGSWLPTEIDDDNFDAIRLAVASGKIVVEAAGNGNTDLDTWINEEGTRQLDRDPDNDSGAIMVGACESLPQHNRFENSNYGARLDCFAWGEDITTTGYGNLNPTATDDRLYTNDFGGTSGAAAIIAGAALILQGMYKAKAIDGEVISPSQMRALLSDPSGTSQGSTVAGNIGVMPNLRAIVETLGLSPDVYVRDDVGDPGDVPSSGSISASPDIIVRPTRVANPAVEFGEGSGTENSNSLGSKVESGQNNFIYVRMRNRSGWATAHNTTATVYWSEVSTLVTPDLWHRIGTTPAVDVPAGDALVVTEPMVWSAADIPAEGHYCFVGILDQARDLAPVLPAIGDWDGFRAFIRQHNNVAWRNFNVVDDVTDPSILPFIIAGAPDASRHFDLQIIQRLPEKAKAVIEVPLGLMAHLPRNSFVRADVNHEKQIATLRLPALRNVPLSNVKLRKGAQYRCRLIVTGLNGQKAQGHSVAIRQIFEEQEVGRVTWSFQQQRDERKESKY